MTRFVRFLSYFTVQSNLLVLVAAVSLVLDPARDGRFWRVVRLDALLGITVTGLVFGAVLAPYVHPTGVAWWINAGFHYVSPVLAVVSCCSSGRARASTVGRSGGRSSGPSGGRSTRSSEGAVVDWYPYPFLDVSQLGYAVALRNVGFVVLLSVALLSLFRFLDRRLNPRP